MREYLSYEDIANTVRMTRSLHSGTIVIVEGDADMRFYNNFIDNTSCWLINATNKNNAIKTLEVLENDKFLGIVAIVDSDFERMEKIPASSKNLFTTDTHDIETMTLKSPALEKVVTEFGSKNKTNGKDIRAIILDAGLPVGYLRWISFKKNLMLSFEDLSFRKFIDKENLTVNTQKLIKTVKEKTRNHILSQKDLMDELNEALNRKDDPWQVCCGHDLVSILSIGFSKVFGSRNTGEVIPEILDRSLRLAYEVFYFSETLLYESLKMWEETNCPFKIFK